MIIHSKLRADKIICVILSIVFLFQQSGLTQAASELNLASYLATRAPAPTPDKFRPLYLRYLDYYNTPRLNLPCGVKIWYNNIQMTKEIIN